eukprot:14945490-Ditylum_brightwellii.AAC.1
MQHDADFSQGSVGIHHSIDTYVHGQAKGIRYRIYIHWKMSGILNSVGGNEGARWTQDPEPG